MKGGKVRDLYFAGIYIASNGKKLKRNGKEKKWVKRENQSSPNIINESFEK